MHDPHDPRDADFIGAMDEEQASRLHDDAHAAIRPAADDEEQGDRQQGDRWDGLS